MKLDESQPSTALHLEDLYVGQRFAPTGTHVLDAEQIIAFARQFDPQPFHLDRDAAAQTLFGKLAASGWHTAAITMRLLVTSGPPLAWGLIGAGGEIHWPRPTHEGDVLQVRSEIMAITASSSKPDRGIVTVCNETFNQHGEVVQRLMAKMVVPTRPLA